MSVGLRFSPGQDENKNSTTIFQPLDFLNAVYMLMLPALEFPVFIVGHYLML